jgi:exodeoxyribonuclease-3
MTLKVLSYNIWCGGDGRLPEITAIIRRQQPYAVALMEASSRANAEALARDLGMQLAFGEANNEAHIAWLSRLPIQQVTNYRQTALTKTMLEIEVDWEGAPLHLFATHLASRHDVQWPQEEVRVILGILRPLAGQPHLLVGDLNAFGPDDPVGTPPGDEEQPGQVVNGVPRRPIDIRRQAIRLLLDAGYVDCYRTLHLQSPGYTYPSAAPWLRLDYVFASPEMAARLWACDLVMGADAEQASDHLPVWAEFLPDLGRDRG